MRLIHGKLTPLTKTSFALLVIVIAFISLFVKAGLLAVDAFPFNADEAIVSLMARHILNGEWQTFFYGQAYMGSLDATLVAVAFALFGENLPLVRVVQILLYLGVVITTAYVGWLIYRSRSISIMAALIMAIPTVNTILYTTVSLGGYGEALLLGNLMLITALVAGTRKGPWMYALWGFFAGLGTWAFALSLVYVIPSGVLLLVQGLGDTANRGFKRNILLAILAFFLGAMPLVLWSIQNGPAAAIEEITGSAIAGASPSSLLTSLAYHAVNFFLFGLTVIFGLRPPWEIRWLALPLLPLVLAFWLYVIGHMIVSLKWRDESRMGRWLLFGVIATLVIGFILSPFGADPSGRYFLPLITPLSLFAAEAIETLRVRTKVRSWAYGVLVVVLGFNLWGTLQAASHNPPGITTQFDSITWIDHQFDQELVDFLIENDETRGYSNYWVAYPLAFLSGEELIFIPRLPYHQDFRYTSRDDRYQPYDVEVERSDNVAYITTNHPALDERLRTEFAKVGVTWDEKTIGDYHVFYNLSAVVRPEDLKIETWHENQ
ncbi:MAG: hypothetical protein GTO18_04540 [Anaerolineales bacterium]|nr:hypothetical protein [Anaerolineales bacterium]